MRAHRVVGRPKREVAAREALEEAGLEGQVARECIGSYRYEKVRRSGALVPCIVEVFPLEVTGQRKHWPEKGQRKMKWLPAGEAARLVSDLDLGLIIRKWVTGTHITAHGGANADKE